MKKILKGNQVIAYAVSQANISVIPVFPITPQTTIIETIAELIKNGKMSSYYIPMESEHSVMAACIGAASAGVRTFTATSGQGLLYMHELLHWASGARLPIVMGVVNRAVAPGWNIWMDQSDTVSQRDTGWIQIYCTTHQEIYDHLFIAYRLSEKVLLPSMVIQDAFFLSHTMGEFEFEENEKINRFMKSQPEIPFAFDFNQPKTLGSLSDDTNYMEFREKIYTAFIDAQQEIKDLYQEFEQQFGRSYPIYETYQLDDAEIVLGLSGTIYETSYEAIDDLRKEGIKAGMVKIRYLRPFFTEELRELMKNKKKMLVIDRNFSFGRDGVFASEIKAALQKDPIEIKTVIAGLGGRDVTKNTVKMIVKKSLNENLPEIYWEKEVFV